jgi:Ca2+-binding EF-hand superfamily protein
MKAKIMQKCPANQGEEGFLAKCFKFFDINNSGEVTFDQFFRTVEKIGVTITKEVKFKFFLTLIELLNGIQAV